MLFITGRLFIWLLKNKEFLKLSKPKENSKDKKLGPIIQTNDSPVDFEQIQNQNRKICLNFDLTTNWYFSDDKSALQETIENQYKLRENVIFIELNPKVNFADALDSLKNFIDYKLGEVFEKSSKFIIEVIGDSDSSDFDIANTIQYIKENLKSTISNISIFQKFEERWISNYLNKDIYNYA